MKLLLGKTLKMPRRKKILKKPTKGCHSKTFYSILLRDSSESVSPSNQEQETDDHEIESLKTQDLATNSEDITQPTEKKWKKMEMKKISFKSIA